MSELSDFHWTVKEQNHAQYNSYDLIGRKGVVNWYPTIELKFPDEFYSREEALLNATVAANAPYMLRLLRDLAEQMQEHEGSDAPVKKWRKRILKEIAVITGTLARA